MKKNLLFVFLLILFVIPLKVNGEIFYFNYGEYQCSEEKVEEKNNLEVNTIIENGKTIYKYRTRDYLSFSDKITITRKDFDIMSLFDTNLPKEEIILKPNYDLETMNNCYGKLIIEYKGTSISKSIYIKIEDYINIPEEIIVNNYDFDIFSYIDTNIDREKLIFNGEYNLYNNGEYNVLVSYNDIEKETKIIVDIKDNIKEEIKEEEIKKEQEQVIIYQEKIIKEIVPNTCSYNNYEVVNNPKEIEYIEKIVPIYKKSNCNKCTDYNKNFRYISYCFYGTAIVLLSIIVVRKK